MVSNSLSSLLHDWQLHSVENGLISNNYLPKENFETQPLNWCDKHGRAMESSAKNRPRGLEQNGSASRKRKFSALTIAETLCIDTKGHP